MKTLIRLCLALAITCCLAAAALAATYAGTRDAIAQREALERTKALGGIFFNHRDPQGGLTLRVENVPSADGADAMPLFALYAPGDADGDPTYYAAPGSGRGYNTATPIEVLAAFTNPNRPARPALNGYVADDQLPSEFARGLYVVGWQTVKSQETPGLGEKIREQSTNATWIGLLTGSNKPEPADRSTHFQKQFRGQLATGYKLRRDGGTVESLTAATYTTNGVMAAIADASAVVERRVPKKAEPARQTVNVSPDFIF